MGKHTVIILPNTLAGLGLEAIIRETFDGIVERVGQFDLMSTNTTNDTDLFVTDESTFVNHLNFFLPNKDKTIILSHRTEFSQGNYRLSPNDSLESITTFLDKFLNPEGQNNSQKLTLREIDVLKLVASGCTNKEIANQLNISINTVLSHRKNITAKLDIKSVSGLSVYAIMNGYIQP